MKKIVRLTVNGTEYEIAVRPNQTLLEVLRDEMDLTGTKEGCGEGDCGACAVLMDGKAVNSCLVPAVGINGRDIVTIEGLAEGGRLHPLQKEFVEKGAIQCGFCSPGMIISAKALLDSNLHPSEGEVRLAISGNLCRCTGYQKIVEAVISAGEKIGEVSEQ